ncbi:DUF3109 family protein [Porphyromonas sp.]|uniref:DUF3109 family protein n=1 Tax=Porphyromonas sp. TaxID=1924944 RepID=UPI0026DB1D49|nr:DUF3109 family protein [Porphyromonas sp.]MDO4695252.1 DUF3109 family protein [Porphyromonas sp.]MDO4771059.1 DUF3109 family protein [Porphyromonas sp.]
MIEIDDTIVSTEIIETFFCCDLEKCKGACCIEGESGAPLLDVEKDLICQAYPLIEHLLPEKNKEYIGQHGLMYYDGDGDLVTNIIRGGECVFTCIEKDGSCRCAFEKEYNEGNNNNIFYKPISCHLYPIRLTKYKDFIAVNYHRWKPICEPARELGKKLGIRLYEFVKDPLIRAFGEEWFRKLEIETERYLADIERKQKHHEQ